MKKSLILSVVFLALSYLTFADIPTKPSPAKLVNDYVGIFTPTQKQQLETALQDFALRTTTQITVVIVKDLGGMDKASFTYEIGEKWGVGKKGFDNGVVIMVKPKEIDGRGETFIATGYGLEGIIPDGLSKRIVENEMIPHFKKKDYFGGVVAAVNVVEGLASKEFTAKDYQKTRRRKKPGSFLLIILLLVIVFIGKLWKTRRYSSSNSVPFWTAWALMNAASRSSSGGYSNFSSGGGSFGGFGGGSFGGGGAGGSW